MVNRGGYKRTEMNSNCKWRVFITQSSVFIVEYRDWSVTEDTDLCFSLLLQPGVSYNIFPTFKVVTLRGMARWPEFSKSYGRGLKGKVLSHRKESDQLGGSVDSMVFDF